MISIPVKSELRQQRQRSRRTAREAGLAGLAVIALGVAACGGSGSPSSNGNSSSAGQPKAGGTYMILANSAFGVADPAQNYTLQEWQLLIDTHDGLVAFERVGGTAGTRLVPDLATGPARNRQLTLGQTLKPSDFVKTFERQFTVPGPTSFYAGIVGASGCSTKGCNLSKGVVADDTNYTLTIHLTAPDPEFTDKLALPFAYVVPAGTTPKLTGNNVPPGTGPYMWQSYNPNSQAVLVRNKYFHVWSAQAQPAGYPDKIVEKYGQTVSDEVTAVENGQADEVFDGDVIPADRLSELNGPQYQHQVHVNALTADWYFAFNTRQPPFNNLKARQAVNFAADRNAYVKIGGGPSLAVPTCQILPPNFPGYKPYCPYTAGGGSTKWTGPDLTKARALVKASGTAGMKVVVNTDIPDKALGEQMVSDLGKIGYKATLQVLAGSIQYPFIQNSNNSKKWNIAWSAWYQDYPAPSDFLNVLLGCGSIHPGSDASPNIAAFCDPAIQKLITKAENLGVTNPTAANTIWAQVDHAMTDQAPWADLYNPKQIDFLSKRVHGYQWNPQWYILIDQQWIK